MGGRRDDVAPGRTALPPVPAGVRPSARPVERADDPPAAAPLPVESSTGRRIWLVVGPVLAAGATAAVFFTENPLYLRVALLAVCWAFVIAAFLAGSRRTDQVAAAGREAELRHAYDLELEREVAARHDYEAELEGALRRESEDGMRTELAQLRGELSGLSALRDDLAAVTQLRADLAGLGQLRTELAALTELRGELSGLSQLRAEIAGLGELRTDLGRMRTELTEQLSGELLIERMVMRAQSVRGPAQPASDPADARTLQGSTAWDPPTSVGSWDVDRWAETRVVPAEPVEPAPRPLAGPPPVPPRAPARAARPDPGPAVQLRPPSPLEWLGDQSLMDRSGQPTGEIPVATAPEPRGHRRAAPDDEESTPAWSAAPSPALTFETPSFETPSWEAPSYDAPSYDAPSYEAPSHEAPSYEAPSWGTPSYETPSYATPSYATPSYETPSWETPSYETPSYATPSWETPAQDEAAGSAPETAAGSSYDGSAYDEMLFGTSTVRPSAEPTPAWEPASSAVPSVSYDPVDRAPDGAAARTEPEPSGHARLEQILAESGVEAPSGGRSRRRRYRDEDAGPADDDVLARVLGR